MKTATILVILSAIASAQPIPPVAIQPTDLVSASRTTINTNFTNLYNGLPGVGASLPATCAVGQLFFLTTATTGQNWYGCTATNTWTLQSSVFPSGTQTQYLQVSPNTGNNTTFRFNPLLSLSASDYNFPAQTPGGNLTTGSRTINMAPCPLGSNGSDTHHYYFISAGTGTAEAALGTGGTCTSGAASGTLILAIANSHSGAWTIQSATAGGQEAFWSNGGTGSISINFPSGVSGFYAPLWIGASGITVAGQGRGVTTILQQTLNTDVIQLASGIQLVKVNDLTLAGSQSSTTGFGINSSALAYVIMSDVFINNTANGVNLVNSILTTLDRVDIRNVVGDGILESGPDGNAINILNSSVASSTGCNASIEIVGGQNTQIGPNNQFLACNYGLLIDPSGGNNVFSTSILSTYFDHNIIDGLAIFAGTGSAVERTTCTDCWASSAGMDGVVVAPTGTVSGLSFVHLRAYLNGLNGVDIQSGNGISITASRIANNGAGNSGIAVAANLSDISIDSNVIGNNIDGLGSGSQAYGIFMNGPGQTPVSITGNLFTGNTTAPLQLSATGMTGMVIASNRGIDDQTATVASASSINVPVNGVPNLQISGTVAISTINDMIPGRQYRFQFTSATPGGMASGGNIYIAKTVTQNQSLLCQYDGTAIACVGP